MKPIIRWGILGTGNIARKFAEGLSYLEDAQLVAVGSRNADTARAFGAQFGVPHAHASYAALAHDPQVDVVYVASPHPFHKEHALLCLQGGKAVLCEKPFTINASEAAEVIAVAREKGLFLMEAMWTRFIPAMVNVRELLAEGAIGAARMLQADFGFRAPFDPRSRLFDPALGGGALLDLGVYPISLASMLFGPPKQITGLAHIGPTGVDDQSAVLLHHPGGELAVLSQALRTQTPQEALIFGERGSIRIHAPFFQPAWFTLSKYPLRLAGGDDRRKPPGVFRARLRRRLVAVGKRSRLLRRLYVNYGALARRVLNGAQERVFHAPIVGNGYQYEAAEVMRCLRAGKLESDVMPLDETLSIMRTLDEVRRQIGLQYPDE